MDTLNSPKRLVQELSDKALREMEIINSQKRQSDKALKYILQERSSTSIHARLMRRYLNEVLNPKLMTTIATVLKGQQILQS